MSQQSQYHSVTVDLPEGSAELVSQALHDLGALGLEVRDREAPPMPGVRGPNPGEAIIVAFFEARADAESAVSEVQAGWPEARVQLEAVPAQDWSNQWKSLIRSVQVGRLWVGPPWEREQAPSDKVVIVVEPKMAFGTGDHPTTSLCLAAVDDFLQAHPNASVLDVGTGTGVLAIAAKKLNAGRVVGIDNDLMSVALAKENAQVNHVLDIDLSAKTLSQLQGPFDLVVANILANTLIELAPALCAHVKNRLVLAGVLQHQKGEVEAAFVKHGLRPLPGASQGEWVRLDFVRA